MVFFGRFVELPEGIFTNIDTGTLKAVCFIEDPAQETAFTMALVPGMSGLVIGNQLWQLDNSYYHCIASCVIMDDKRRGACVDLMNPRVIAGPEEFYAKFGREPKIVTEFRQFPH